MINNSEGYDYTSFYDGSTPVIKTHYGIFGEIIRSQSFLEYEKGIIEPINKEHVTPFLYQSEDSYRINKIKLPEDLRGLDNLRLTVDTEEDFELAEKLYAKHSFNDGINYNIKSLFNEIRDDKMIQRKMNQQIQQNSK